MPARTVPAPRTVSHYEVLGVGSNASAQVIKRAYYRKARAYHPDAHAGSTAGVLHEAQRSMAALNAAWNVLRDADLRAEYDRALEEAARVSVGRRGGRRANKLDRRETLELGPGFHYWMGASGLLGDDGDDAGYRMSLLIDGAKDLSGLRSLPPNGVFALRAAGAAIDDGQLAHIAELTGLQALDLSDTLVTDAGLLHLLQLERLEHLWLWGTRISDAGLALLGQLVTLRLLGLGNTQVTDAGLAGLAGLRRLRILQLAGTEVSGRGLEHLHGLIELERVTLPLRVSARHRRSLKAALARNEARVPLAVD
jgi:hypothetical protein